jgi:molybdopterin-guanine dinucleotide biosynthesis protein MobB
MVAVCGVKKVGKTTFLVNLIPLLRREGLKVAAIKHDAHDFEPDVPGTDSYRLRAAGATGVAVYSPARQMIIKEAPGATPEELVKSFSDFQIVLLEGGKNSPYPKIELLRQGVSPGPTSSPPHLAYCVEGSFRLSGVPVFGLSDYPAIADLLISRL